MKEALLISEMESRVRKSACEYELNIYSSRFEQANQVRGVKLGLVPLFVYYTPRIRVLFCSHHGNLVTFTKIPLICNVESSH